MVLTMRKLAELFNKPIDTSRQWVDNSTHCTRHKYKVFCVVELQHIKTKWASFYKAKKCTCCNSFKTRGNSKEVVRGMVSAPLKGSPLLQFQTERDAHIFEDLTFFNYIENCPYGVDTFKPTYSKDFGR